MICIGREIQCLPYVGFFDELTFKLGLGFSFIFYVTENAKTVLVFTHGIFDP